MLKKFLVVILAAMLVVLSACSNSSKQTTAKDDNADLPKLDSFNWQAFKGQEINVMLNQHPYADAIIKRLPEFEAKTGIKVKYSVTPEDSYFDKLTTALNAQNGNPDVFMTGAYQIWEYAPAGYIQSLTPFLKDKNRVASDYDASDFIPGVLNALKWDLKPGHKVGSGNQWALPLGYETNVLLYNKKAFEKAGIAAPPATFDELMKDAAKLNGWNGEGSYGIALRGTRSWATIHPGYMTAFVNNGAKDFAIKDGKLVSQLDSKESIDITKKFTQMINESGPKDWSNYTWYQVSTDLGAGKAAMAYDADNFAFYNNQAGASKEAGNIAVAPPPAAKDGAKVSSNMWVWSISMNKSSKHKDASWLFMQYFTSKDHMIYGATKMNVVDPVRQSVWDDAGFKERIGSIEGYAKTFDAIKENATVQFTPQPEFFNTTTEWAAAIQDIVNGSKPEERLKSLTEQINKILSRVKVE
jgi:multiple sugar transport system substrate-binding protein